MNIPFEMQEAIEELVKERSISEIRDCVSLICERYDKDSGHGAVLVKNEKEAVSYAVSRMPGTYGAVRSALEAVAERTAIFPSSLLDIGSGTGAAVWAVDSMFNLSSVTCVERESGMIQTGKHMLSFGSEAMKNAVWLQKDVTVPSGVKTDLVTASYVMNELNPDKKQAFLENLWNSSNDSIILIEPGTKAGYANIRLAREFFIKNGAYVYAPCTHEKECPLPADDWCHFSCRMQRSKIQKFVKGGDAPFEDEKFSYIAVRKEKAAEQEDESGERIIRHPIIEKGAVTIKTCSSSGIKETKITQRDKAKFKAARKAEWGEMI